MYLWTVCGLPSLTWSAFRRRHRKRLPCTSLVNALSRGRFVRTLLKGFFSHSLSVSLINFDRRDTRIYRARRVLFNIFCRHNDDNITRDDQSLQLRILNPCCSRVTTTIHNVCNFNYFETLLLASVAWKIFPAIGGIRRTRETDYDGGGGGGQRWWAAAAITETSSNDNGERLSNNKQGIYYGRFQLFGLQLCVTHKTELNPSRCARTFFFFSPVVIEKRAQRLQPFERSPHNTTCIACIYATAAAAAACASSWRAS